MNIFYLDENPFLCAFRMTAVPKHIVKMPLESMQILSTNVRMLVGEVKTFEDDFGCLHRVNVLEGERVLFADVLNLTMLDGSQRRSTLRIGDKIPKGVQRVDIVKQKPYYDPETQRALAATHENHPSTVWARQSLENHRWLVAHTKALEYWWKAYYGHSEDVQHKSVALLDRMPEPSLPSTGFTQPTPAMPDQYKVEGDSLASYWNYYRAEKLNL